MTADTARQAKVDMFRRTRALVAQARAALPKEEVPEELRASVEAMLASSGIDGPHDPAVIPFRRPVAPARSRPWQMAAAASVVAAIAGGLAGTVLSDTFGTGSGKSYAAVGGLLPRDISAALTAIASGGEQPLADGRIRLIATMRTAGGNLCREFEVDALSGQAIVGVGCKAADGWQLNVAVAAPQTADGFAPASSLIAIDSYLDTIEAGEPLSPEEEAAVLEAT